MAVNQTSIPAPVRRYLEIIKPYASAPQQQLLNHGWIIGGEFPPPLWRGFGVGALAGLLLGLLFAWLLLRNTLVIPNAEGLFSLGPFTFYTLWAMVGTALGILFGGVGTILAVDPTSNTIERPHTQAP